MEDSPQHRVVERTISRRQIPSIQEETDVFRQARSYLQPTPLFRFVASLYSERKLLIFLSIHFVSLLIAFFHHFLVKWYERKENVGEEDSQYWLKRVGPSLLFGSKHAMLLEMTLIPLTMSRYSITVLSETICDRFVPFNRMLRVHMHLGYNVAVLVMLATILFLGYFGSVCARGDQAFCDALTGEIMITGYLIFAFVVVIAGTSHFRHQIPYEVFYIIHQLIYLVFYLIALIHTMDKVERQGTRDRSQTFKWFTVPILYYIVDRCFMFLNQRFNARLASASLVNASDGSKMIIIKLRRPILLDFKPGQYAFIRLPEVDRVHFHPFSIASSPDSSSLDFYIEVFAKDSWTHKLWDLLEKEQNTVIEEDAAQQSLVFEVMGPYGTSLDKSVDCSHAIAVGAGTGIVPVLSLFQQHVQQLLRLDPKSHARDIKDRHRKTVNIELARQPLRGSLAQKTRRTSIIDMPLSDPRVAMLEQEKRRRDIREVLSERESSENQESSTRDPHTSSNLRVSFGGDKMKSAAFKATRSVYGIVGLGILPVLGVALIGLTISWNTIRNPNNIPRLDVELGHAFYQVLLAFTVIFQFAFAVIALGIWDASEFLFYIDFILICVTPFLDWVWFAEYAEHERLGPGEIAGYTLLVSYMTGRLWNRAVQEEQHSLGSSAGQRNTLDCLDVVWVTRSAHLVSEILPEITSTWYQLVNQWGEENAKAACSLSIYVTDKDVDAIESLRGEVEHTGFEFNSGRPDFEKILETQTLKRINSHRTSHTLLAFCGGPGLALKLHQFKIANDMLVAVTGHACHAMSWVAENYGGTKSPKPKEPAAAEASMEVEIVFGVTSPESGRQSPSLSSEGGHRSAGSYNLSKRRSSVFLPSESSAFLTPSGRDGGFSPMERSFPSLLQDIEDEDDNDTRTSGGLSTVIEGEVWT